MFSFTYKRGHDVLDVGEESHQSAKFPYMAFRISVKKRFHVIMNYPVKGNLLTIRIPPLQLFVQ